MSATPPNGARKSIEISIALAIPHPGRPPDTPAKATDVTKLVYFLGSPEEFSVSFPSHDSKQADASHGSLVVLVVDDDPDIRLIVSDVLEFEGYQVVNASDGAEALRVIRHIRPDLVLLDMRMPVMDGWEFAVQLKQQGIMLPILMMTAATDARRWATDIQAQGFLSKPFDILELLEAVTKLTTN